MFCSNRTETKPKYRKLIQKKNKKREHKPKRKLHIGNMIAATSPNVVGVGGSGPPSTANQLISTATSTALPTSITSLSSISGLANASELTFNAVHEAFGREIHEDLTARKRQKELTAQPLIDF